MKRSKPEAAAPASDAGACMRSALTLLARREHGERELVRKLTTRGFVHEVVANAVAELKRSGALAERRFVESFVRSRINRGRGPARIRAELNERGVAGAEVSEALGGADVDWLGAIRAVRRKRFGPDLPRDYAERARQARFLQYRGFDSSQIRAALEVDADSD